MYTSYSAVYPDCFGNACGFAHKMFKEDPPLSPEGVLQQADMWGRILYYHYLPSVQERLEEAEEIIASCFCN